MIPAGFTQALVSYAERLGSVGLQQLVDESTELFGKVQAGDGTQLISSSVNGKSFGFQANMTVEEKFTAFSDAVRQLTGDKIVSTQPDFRGIRH